MKKVLILGAIFTLLPTLRVDAQSANGGLEFTARITPTAAKPEPVRDVTFYVLTKSYDDIVKEIEERDGSPAREKFIDGLKLSPELRAWLQKHEVMDLTLPGVDKLITPDDVLQVPEFLQAYERSNRGGVTSGLPVPKFREADKTGDPARYEKQHHEYLSALKKFITGRPETMSGMELELDGVNPARKWAEVQNTHKRRVLQMAPAEAQTKYLAAKADTDLEGHASIGGLAPGNYWLSTLALTATAGDARLRWDVPVKIAAGQTVRIELTNLNATDNLSSR
jgi:hypothetical protein